MPYGFENALHEIINADEGYVAATGKLTFDESKLPKVDMMHQDRTKTLTRISAWLKGSALTKSGFTHPLNTALTFEVNCYGPWCAGASSGKDVLAFLKKTDAGYMLSTNPCGGHVFYEPTKAILKSVARCYTHGVCPKPPSP
jgi:hypothetical protein